MSLLLSNFDFGYMLIINVLTYIMIEVCKIKWNITLWMKRLFLLISIVIITILYKLTGFDNNIILINSAILAPVSWSWIFKPIINYFKNKNNG